MEKNREVLAKTIVECREAVDSDPENPQAREALGDALKAGADMEGAFAEYREVTRLLPGAPSGHYKLGLALVEKDDVEGALKEYREALALEPGDSAAHYFIGMALVKKGDLEGAIKEYRESLRLEPDDVAAQMSLSCALGLKGDALAKQRIWKGAVELYREAERVSPEIFNAHERLRDSVDAVCKNLRAIGDTELLTRIYQGALDADPENDALQATRAGLFSQQKEWDAAIKNYRIAVELKPDNDDWHLELGDALAKQRNWQEALIEYCEADRLGSHIDAHEHLGEVVGECCDELVKTDNLNQALLECRSALIADPQNVDLHCRQGDLLAQIGEPEKAFTEYCEANRLEPKINAHSKFFFSMFKRYSQCDWEHRLSGFMGALRVDPENADLATEVEIAQITLAGQQYEQGRTLAAKGNLIGAIERYRDALEVRGDYDQARLSLCAALLSNRDPVGALWESIEYVGKTPWKRLLVQYLLLLAATAILAWSLGVINSRNVVRYLPRLATFPLGIMLLVFSYKRFFGQNK